MHGVADPPQAVEERVQRGRVELPGEPVLDELKMPGQALVERRRPAGVTTAYELRRSEGQARRVISPSRSIRSTTRVTPLVDSEVWAARSVIRS